MNNWLQNIKGQITELATEVLNDATEEGQVSVSSELQVEKKKCVEAERQCLAEKAKNEAMEKRVAELEEQLFNTNMENDAIKEKFTGIVNDREEQIKRLNWEIERMRCSEEGEFKNIPLESLPKMGPISANLEAEKAMAKLKEKHECEITAIMAANATNLQQIRAEYEGRIREIELWSSAATTDKSEKNQTEIITKLQQEVAKLKALADRSDEFKAERDKLSAERTEHLEEIKQLKALNTELMTSYDETCAKLEEQRKSGDNSHSETILDLSSKISSLKSMLNETESRYELCKMEQTETANRLEVLLKEFADLRSSMHAAQANAEGTERDLMSEVHSLRDTLEHTKADREKLISDFRESVRAVGEELAELKECNQRLKNENSQLNDSLYQLNALREALNASDEELSNFRAKFAEMETKFTKEIERVTEERDGLRNEMDKMKIITDERQCQTDERREKWAEDQIAEIFEQNAQLKAELNERDEELRRVRNDKVLMEDIRTTTDGQCKRPPSDTDSATSNNDWERMGKEDIEVEGVSSSAGSEEKETPVTNRRKKSAELRDSSTQTDEMPLDAESTTVAEDICGRNAEMEQQREELTLLRSETEKLELLLQQKHSECQNYYEKLQEMGKIVQGKSAKLESAEETLKRREKEIAFDRERMAKLEGDLHRLRKHLLTVEEHSSKDAIAAEERETELRRQIRFLQEKASTEGNSLANSLEQNQLQISELNSKMAQIENDKNQLEAMVREKEKMLTDANRTLADLQGVLKELADDQKMEKQKTDAELWSIREEMKQKTQTLKEMEEAKANLEDEFASITHELNMSREQLLRKENLVEELENQLEEMRFADGSKHYSSADSSVVGGINGKSGGAVTSHKIDDATLRQLFLSYFTADKSKQPEIAIVMSRILGYSAEEQSQINEALSKSASSTSSWFAPFSASPSASSPPGGLSLTEQFVRFLEKESMANTRALLRPPIHSLPSTDSPISFLVGESPPVPTQSSSSSADLKSMLEQ